MRHTDILAVTGAALLGGCATITHGTRQTVAISTPGATAATCHLTDGKSLDKTVTAPASLVLHKNRAPITVACTAAAGQTASRTFKPTRVTASKIQTPGGYLADTLSGAMWAYPDQMVVPFDNASAQGNH